MATVLQSFRSPVNWLLAAVPAAFALRFLGGDSQPLWVFLASACGIVPLAGLLGKGTEQIAARSGAGLGGLLNATFGNAAELIIGLMGLAKGLPEVVKASLTGSIIGNLLLVLGASMFAGGLRYPRQKFNQTAARALSSTLSIAALAIVIPTIFHVTVDHSFGGWAPAAEHSLSLAIAIVLMAAYVGSLVFSLMTHRALFAGEAIAEEHEKLPPLSVSIGVLLVATVFIAVLSEFLLDAMGETMSHLGLTETFVGIIIVALVGNAAEHATAVQAALKNRMDLTLGISMGSSTQIALFVIPVLVIASYGFGKPITMEFSLPEVAAILGSVWVAQQVSGDGESNWLEGFQLLALYVILGLLFFFLPAHHS